MPDLERRPVTATIEGAGICVRIVAVAGQFLVSGADVPANTVEGDDPYAVWLAPGRRLVVGAIASEGNFVSDVSDGLVVIEISGAHTDELLAMGCPLDIGALARGRCAQTLFAGVKTLIYRHGDAVRLHIERSLAQWLLDWLQVAATSFERVG